MHSERTVGFEFTNGENTLANFSADGALLFMQHGREYDDIFAHWDWRMVPGTTAYDDGMPLKCEKKAEFRKNCSGHVGGAISGDVLCTTMEVERDGLHALKSAFFFGDLVVALGADIRSSDPRMFCVTTALDQTHLAGPVVSGDRSTKTRPSVARFSNVGSNMIWPGRAVMPMPSCRAGMPGTPDVLHRDLPCALSGTMPDARPSNMGRLSAP